MTIVLLHLQRTILYFECVQKQYSSIYMCINFDLVSAIDHTYHQPLNDEQCLKAHGAQPEVRVGGLGVGLH